MRFGRKGSADDGGSGYAWPSALRQVDYWAYFPDSEGRAAFIRFAQGQGFAVASVIEPEDRDDEFGVHLVRDEVPDPVKIDIASLKLDAAAQLSGGHCDGWGMSCDTDEEVRHLKAYLDHPHRWDRLAS
jgi:Regulator of ribonuclease activity B